MLRLQITMTTNEARVLYALAERERRTPRQQAAVVLSEALRGYTEQGAASVPIATPTAPDGQGKGATYAS